MLPRRAIDCERRSVDLPQQLEASSSLAALRSKDKYDDWGFSPESTANAPGLRQIGIAKYL
jgi:hypothetical protein